MNSNKLTLFVGHVVSYLIILRHEYLVHKIKKLHPQIHQSVRIGFDTSFPGNGRVIIGEGTYLGRNCFLSAHPNENSIEIGKYCAISHNVNIRTNGYQEWDGVKRDRKSIGNVIIGDGATIGANAVVLTDIPSGATAVGVPARIINNK